MNFFRRRDDLSVYNSILKVFFKIKLPKLAKEIDDLLSYDSYISGIIGRSIEGDNIPLNEIHKLDEETIDKIFRVIDKNNSRDGKELLIYYLFIKVIVEILRYKSIQLK